MATKVFGRFMSTLALAVLLCGTEAVAAQKGDAKNVTLRWGDHMPQCCTGYAWHGQWYVDEMLKRSNGSFKIDISFGGVLGTVGEIPDAIESGLLDIGNITTPYFPDQLPINNAIPFHWPQPRTQRELGELMIRWNEEIPAFAAELAKYNAKLIAVRPLNTYGFICKTPVRTVADFKGKRTRIYGVALPAMVEALGGVPVGMSDVEIYEAFSNNLIDCAAADRGNVEAFKFYEVAKYFIDVPLNASWGHIIGMNLDVYNALSDEHKALMEPMKRDSMNAMVDWYDADNERIRKRWAESGDVEIINFPAQDFLDVVLKAPAVQAVRNGWKDRAIKAGLPEADAQRVINDITRTN